VNVNVPAVVGVPVRVADCVPLDARVRPGGEVPLVTAKETGVTPPLLVMLALYAVFAVPLGRALVGIASGFTIVMLKFCEALCGGTEESVTVTWKFIVPVVAAVKLRLKVEPLLLNTVPGGIEPATFMEYWGVPPLQLRVAVYGMLVIAVLRV
jgi:hypothetical protein